MEYLQIINPNKNQSINSENNQINLNRLNNHHQCIILLLPEELLGEIFSFLHLSPDIYHLSLVCSKFYNTIHTPAYSKIYLLGFISDHWIKMASLPKNIMNQVNLSSRDLNNIKEHPIVNNQNNQIDPNNPNNHIDQSNQSNQIDQSVNIGGKYNSFPILWEDFDQRYSIHMQNNNKFFRFIKTPIKKYLKYLLAKKNIGSLYLYISQNDIAHIINLLNRLTSNEGQYIVNALESITIEASCRSSIYLDKLIMTIFEKCRNLKFLSLYQIPIVGNDPEDEENQEENQEDRNVQDHSNHLNKYVNDKVIEVIENHTDIKKDNAMKSILFSNSNIQEPIPNKLRVLKVKLCHFSNQLLAMERLSYFIKNSNQIHTLFISGNLENLSMELVNSIALLKNLTNLTMEIRNQENIDQIQNAFSKITSLMSLTLTISFDDVKVLPVLLSSLPMLSTLKITTQGSWKLQHQIYIPKFYIPNLKSLYLDTISPEHLVPLLNIGPIENLVINSTVYDHKWISLNNFLEELKKLKPTLQCLGIYLPFMSLNQDETIKLTSAISFLSNIRHLQWKLQINDKISKAFWKNFLSNLSHQTFITLKLDFRSVLSNLSIHQIFPNVTYAHISLHGAISFSIDKLFQSFPQCRELYVDCFTFKPPKQDCSPSLVSFNLNTIEVTTKSDLYQLAKHLKSVSHVSFNCAFESKWDDNLNSSLQEDLQYPSFQEYFRVVQSEDSYNI